MKNKKMSKQNAKKDRPRQKTLVEIVCEDQNLTERRPSAEEMLKLFRRWLRSNMARFPFSPVLIGMSGKDKFREPVFRFRGVSEQISFTVGPHGIRTHFDLAGEYFDTWNDFEVYAAKTPNGTFVCVMCLIEVREGYGKKGKSPREFKTLYDLYADHCFEKLLRWARKYVRPGNVIIYEGSIESKGFRAAYIRPLRQILRAQEPALVLPVIQAVKGSSKREMLALY